MNDIERLIDDLGITPATLARRLGVSEAAVSRWRTGKHAPSGLYALRVAELQAEALQRRRRGGDDAAAALAAFLDHATPVAGPADSDYDRGYRRGYRDALAAVLAAVAAAGSPHDPSDTSRQELTHR